MLGFQKGSRIERNYASVIIVSLLIIGLSIGFQSTTIPSATAYSTPIRFAVIGDYGTNSQAEADVANLVKSWSPDFVITVGDNNVPDGATGTIDINIGQYYHSFIYPYTGNYGAGADQNRFFPTLGNHDWRTIGASPYLTYFTLPGNERYYEFAWGPVHFFALDSDSSEPDGNMVTSTQATWLKERLAASTESWKLVYFHNPPYSSGLHGPSTGMQWPFQQWGASAVLSGHDHDYERLLVNGFPYFVDGLGGDSIYAFGTPLTGSQVRYNSDYGAMLVQADASSIDFKFYSRAGILVDDYQIVFSLPQAPSNLVASASSNSQVNLAWTDNSVNEDGFKIERATALTGPWSQIATTGPDVNSYIDTGLTPSTTYFYRICAYNAGGNSGYSNIASAKTLGSASHVNDIVGSWSKKGQLYVAYATVTVVDQNGVPVPSAKVYGLWSGAWNGNVNGVTDKNGKVRLSSGGVRNGGTFTFTVADIIKTDWTYDRSMNVKTSVTIICSNPNSRALKFI
jgi:hypothetical protein